ncbi:serine/threonine-protein kinase [Caldimonas aquatica]|uniref:Serine/threonine protein kinase n=1 Tax=Caldimonas aquatica TaxID=376175 RepID=A0ABY6MNL2_9BURK|nr:serine/threonine-protein kinase [Schlegelella aquatica]UZD54094.1 serine/threonine protein kinase [Schlegelella aquatica]
MRACEKFVYSADTVEFQKTVLALPGEPGRDADAAPGRHPASPLHERDTAAGDLPDSILEAERPGTGDYDGLPTIGHIGRYALKYRLGEGGLGTVYAAQDPLLSRLVAIKTLSVDLSPEGRERFNEMFLNEARAVASLTHPHIVTVFDAGTSEQGAYIAMELLKGKDLRQLLKEGWRPKPDEAALLVRRVADALAYAHSKGVVHRDVKPANIFMVGRTQPKVLDFGIARVASQQESPSGGDEFAVGSPYYMAPEQVRHEPVDRRCDVFSLGVVLYELLTGTKPFQGATLSDIATAVIAHRPAPAHEVNPQVPPALSAIAARAMEKNPDDRYRSARVFSRELRHWLEEEADASAQQERAQARHRQRTGLWLLLGGGAALVVASAAYRFGHDTAPTAEDAAAPGAHAAVPAASSAATDAAELPAQATAPPPAVAQRTADSSAGAATAAAGQPGALARAGSGTPPAPARRPRESAGKPANGAVVPTVATPAVPAATGTVTLAVSPWAHVEVDGQAAGTVPPLNRLTLTEGRHTITLRNDEFPPHSVTVNVSPGQPVTVKHKFGP